jgi:hypothetical protein
VIKITDKHGPRLARMDPASVIPAMGEELLFQAREIADDAILSIKDGAISGSGHVPAPPGQPPNEDTGELSASIRPLDLVETPVSVQTGVISDSGHSLYQERGTSKMEARPFLEPAAERHRVDTLRALHGRYVDLLRG